MTFVAGTSRDFASFDRRRPAYGLSIQGLGGATVLGAVVVVGAWMLATQPFAEWSSNPAPPSAAAKPHVAQAKPAVPVFTNPTVADATVHLNSAMLDPNYTAGLAAMAVARHAPLDPQFKSTLPDAHASTVEAERVVPVPPPAPILAEAIETVPLPTPRPADLDTRVDPAPDRPQGRSFGSSRHVAAAPAQPPDSRNMFEKLFGLSSPSGPALAYAAPEPSGLPGASNPRMVPGPVVSVDKLTAVYDISAHAVYMPDGSVLEAHSGLGNRLDDPGHVAERDRGATPPHAYDLEPRAQLFHGVKALRLNPVGGGGVFGRAGLLAHSFMLGPNGDSNGCVSFRNYNAFLQAYESGAVRRLVVVARRS